jgi:hypothetical protein
MQYYVAYEIKGKIKIYISKNIDNIKNFIDACIKNNAQLNIKLLNYIPVKYSELSIKLEIEKLKNYIKFYRRELNAGNEFQ